MLRCACAIHVDVKGRSRIPTGRNSTARAGRLLQRAAVAGRRTPDIIRLAAGAECAVRGICVTIVDHIESFRAVASLPVAQGRCVNARKRGARPTACRWRRHDRETRTRNRAISHSARDRLRFHSRGC